jgi:GT2 family glycosyltransferase
MTGMATLGERLSIVIITYNRPGELLRTLKQMHALPEQPPIIVVDNASNQDVSRLVQYHFPKVKTLRLTNNLGAAARNLGVQRARTPYIAFCDDDTWWQADALRQAVDLLDAYPHVAVLSAKILIGDTERKDPACLEMEHSPLNSDHLPGRAVLGYFAGACVFRRDAFLDAGGYEPNLFIGGEEALLALDLATRGWLLLYAPQLIVHHYPSLQRDVGSRQKLLARNAIWIAWMRLPWDSALKQTLRILYTAYRQDILPVTAVNVLRGLPWVMRHRRVIPIEVESMYRRIQH